jgi:hypothetical protein
MRGLGRWGAASLYLLIGAGVALALSGRIRGVREESAAVGTLFDGASALAVPPPRPAAAPPPDESPLDARAFLARGQAQIRELLTSAAPAGVVSSRVDAMVDYPEVVRRMFGKSCPTGASSCVNHWDTLTGEQQAELTALVQRLVAKHVESSLARTLAYDVFYGTTTPLGGDLSKVRTEATRRSAPREPAVQVDYLVRGASRHGVVDVVTEGSSMTKGYYDQFHRMLTTPDQGYAYLVKKVEAKLAR